MISGRSRKGGRICASGRLSGAALVPAWDTVVHRQRGGIAYARFRWFSLIMLDAVADSELISEFGG